MVDKLRAGCISHFVAAGFEEIKDRKERSMGYFVWRRFRDDRAEFIDFSFSQSGLAKFSVGLSSISVNDCEVYGIKIPKGSIRWNYAGSG